MTELSTPSRDLAQRLMAERGWEGRLRGDRYNAMAGSLQHFLYSLEEAANFLEGDLESLAEHWNGSVCVVDPTDLMTWVRDTLGDEQLARAIGSRLAELDACQDPIERQRKEIALIQPLKELLLTRVRQCREVLGDRV